VKGETVKMGGELPIILGICLDYVIRTLFLFFSGLRNLEGMFIIFAGRVSMTCGGGN